MLKLSWLLSYDWRFKVPRFKDSSAGSPTQLINAFQWRPQAKPTPYRNESLRPSSVTLIAVPQTLDEDTDSESATSETTVRPGEDPNDCELVGHQKYAKGEKLPFSHIQELGRGGYAIVDEVERISSTTDRPYKKTYARKVVRIPNRYPHLLDNLIMEVEVIKRLHQRHIITLVSSYEQLGRFERTEAFALIMSPVAELNLREYLEQTEAEFQELRKREADAWSRLQQEQTIESANEYQNSGEMYSQTRSVVQSRLSRWYGCLASGLSYIHRQRVRHKDIKPTNLLVKGDNILYADFGLSKVFDNDDTTMTHEYPSTMTPKYCAPEVAQDLPRGRPSDIFSLGCVYAEMVTVHLSQSLTGFEEFRGAPNPHAFHLDLDLSLQWLVHLYRTAKAIKLEDDDMTDVPLQLTKPVQWCCEMLNPEPLRRIKAFGLTECTMHWMRKTPLTCSCMKREQDATKVQLRNDSATRHSAEPVLGSDTQKPPGAVDRASITRPTSEQHCPTSLWLEAAASGPDPLSREGDLNEGEWTLSWDWVNSPETYQQIVKSGMPITTLEDLEVLPERGSSESDGGQRQRGDSLYTYYRPCIVSRPTSPKSDVDQATVKRWAEAKSYLYDGSDWGSSEDDDYVDCG
ncbi:MAG: hypothetical protein M1827_001961 [Pycnora praestabilis]|nr:MAG: hypothetical protein M1827_001961 [Pycnora praestabilis]